MKNIFLLYFIFSFHGALAQDSLDSLNKVLSVALVSGDSLGIARTYYKLGIAYDKQDNFEKSNSYLNKALLMAKEIKSSKAIAVITNYLASNYSEQGRQWDAIELYEQSYDLFISLNDSAEAAAVYMNIGTEYLDMSKYEQALEYEIKALKMKEQVGDSLNIAYFYQSVGELFKLLDMLDKWKEYLKKANELSDNPYYADIKTRIAILKDLAGLKEREGDYDAALVLYEKLYSTSEKDGYVRGMNVAYSSMSNVFKAQKKYSEAIDVAKKAYELSLLEQNVLVIVNRCNNVGNIYLASGNGFDAGKWFRLALQNAQNKYPDEQIGSYKGLYEASKLTNDYKSATDFIEKYITLKDSIEDLSMKKRVTELETIYQTEKNRAEIVSLNQQNKIQRQKLSFQNLLLWSIVVIAIFVIVIVSLVLRQQRLKSRNKEIMLQQKLLRSQMNPHFIFNSLGAIQNFMYQSENKKASFYLGSFSSLMRAILVHSREELISLDEEIKILNNYMELQKMRLGFNYEVICDDSIDDEFTLIPPMLIQPFVENAIKHGVAEMSDKGGITVTFSKSGSNLKIVIDDNGVGINSAGKSGSEDHKSLALEIFKERLMLLSYNHKKKVVYKIIDKSETNSNQTGTMVIVELPLILD
jgi:tetratricopeptide (TPR) repeat protein